MQYHLRKLVDVDRSDAGKGYQADCTENDILLGEGPVLAADVSFLLQVKSGVRSLPMDHLEKQSAAFEQG